jgi:cytochrome c1
MKVIFLAIFTTIIAVSMVIWFGVYNVAANDKHFAMTEQFFEWVRDRSIIAHSKELVVPNLDNKEWIKQGAQFYAEMCTGCHLTPNEESTELYSGLYPKPPVFSGVEYKNTPAAQFWVIKNGLKMTGMPAWSPSHTDQQIWTMVAFINQLQSLSLEQYEMLIQATEGGSHHHDGGHSH